MSQKHRWVLIWVGAYSNRYGITRINKFMLAEVDIVTIIKRHRFLKFFTFNLSIIDLVATECRYNTSSPSSFENPILK